MAQEKDKQRYVPPEITRVVLRSEQAVLSACQTGAPAMSGGGAFCVVGCKTSPAPAPVASAATS